MGIAETAERRDPKYPILYFADGTTAQIIERQEFPRGSITMVRFALRPSDYFLRKNRLLIKDLPPEKRGPYINFECPINYLFYKNEDPQGPPRLQCILNYAGEFNEEMMKQLVMVLKNLDSSYGRFVRNLIDKVDSAESMIEALRIELEGKDSLIKDISEGKFSGKELEDMIKNIVKEVLVEFFADTSGGRNIREQMK